MKITFLGQAGLLLEEKELTVLIDPYLSHSVEKINPKSKRRVPVDESFFSVKPDVMIFTHNHLDHYDPETAERFLAHGGSCTVLAPKSVWNEVRKFGGDHNYVCFNRHSSWSQGSCCFTAVKAEHSDDFAIGVLIENGEQTYYVTGDTLYNEEIFSDLPKKIDVLFLPVNGKGNNMNAVDAARFAERTGAEKVVPFHIGMFDSLTADCFKIKNKITTEIYKEIEL